MVAMQSHRGRLPLEIGKGPTNQPTNLELADLRERARTSDPLGGEEGVVMVDRLLIPNVGLSGRSGDAFEPNMG